MPQDITQTIPEITHHMALLPLGWLAILWLGGQSRSRLWWGVAAAFAISWLADTAAHWIRPDLVATVYPAAQATLLVAVFRPQVASPFGVTVILAAVAALLLPDWPAGDMLGRALAWLGLLAIVWPVVPGRLRWCLGVAFGGGWVAWLGYQLAPGWPSWLVYQGARAVSLGLFCWASLVEWRPIAHKAPVAA